MSAKAAASPDNADDNSANFVRRTYRSTIFVALFVVFVLASYGQFWALLPVAGGVLLGLVLLRALEWSIRGAFTPERARDAKRSGKARPKAALIGAALIKYPVVAGLIFLATRFWNEREIMAFAGGFILLQLVIALRGMGQFVVDRLNDTEKHK